MSKKADATAELEQLFEKLHGLLVNNQHAKALKLIESILKASPGDEDALKCKAVAYIQESEYEEALKFLSNRKLEGQMQFERAYCMYRCEKFEQALKALAEVPPEQQEAALQLQAQLYYRLGDMDKCMKAYNSLMQDFNVESLDVKANILAAHVAAGLSAQVPALISSLNLGKKLRFEAAYNKACAVVETGDYSAAETALKLAIKQGEEQLYEEDFSEEEILDELASLFVQLAYVLGQQGRPADAIERLEPLVMGELSDIGVAAVATNNWVVESYAADMHAKGFFGRSIKKLDALLDRSASDPLALAPASRLTRTQQQAIHLNRALLYLLAGKQEQAKELAGLLAKAYPGNSSVTMLQAVLLARSGKAGEADALLANLPTPRDTTTSSSSSSAAAAASLHPLLLRLQLALESGSVVQAQQLLQGLDKEVQMAPALLATRVALHEQSGDVAGAEALLDSALKHWQKAQQQNPRDELAHEGLGWCLQRLVSLKLSLGKAAEAMALYLQLSKLGLAGDVAGAATLAKLVRAAAVKGDSKAIAQLQQELPDGSKAGSGFDLDALEDLNRAVNSMKRKEEAMRKREAEAASAEEQPRVKKAKKKKKPRYPKGWDPSLPNGGMKEPPNPERWLPKWQRSDAKKKQRRRRDRQETVKGSQGAGKVDETLDRSKGTAEPEAKPAAAPKPQLPARPAGKGKPGRK